MTGNNGGPWGGGGQGSGDRGPSGNGPKKPNNSLFRN